MKDYLQLDGLVYKLVPIKTPINEENPYQMGRIEPNRMYDIVKNGNGVIQKALRFIMIQKQEKTVFLLEEIYTDLLRNLLKLVIMKKRLK